MGDGGDWEGVGKRIFIFLKNPISTQLNSTQRNTTKNWRFFTQKEKKPAQNLKFNMKN